MISLDFLKTVEIFQGLSHEQLADIIKCGEEVALQDETRLFEKGENAAYLWIVREDGWICDLIFRVWRHLKKIPYHQYLKGAPSDGQALCRPTNIDFQATAPVAGANSSRSKEKAS